MNLIKYVVAALMPLCAVGADMKPAEFITLDVVTVAVKKNVLNYHMGDQAYGFDLAEVKVETSGPWLGTTLPIAIPQTGTTLYKETIAAVPVREKMWAILRESGRKLVMEVRKSDVENYLKIKGDPSRVLPSIDALNVKSVEPKQEATKASRSGSK